MNTKVEWVMKTGKYSTIHKAYVGKVCVGEYFYIGWRGSTDPLKYALNCRLPQVKRPPDFATPEEAMAHMQTIVDQWFAFTQKERT